MNDGALLAVTRLGLGPKPGEIAALAGDPRGAVLAMIERPQAALMANPPIPDPYLEMKACYQWKGQRRRLLANGFERKTRGGRQRIREEIGPMCFAAAYRDEVAARVAHATGTDAPFVERLVQFWSNHFSISAARRNQIEVL